LSFLSATVHCRICTLTQKLLAADLASAIHLDATVAQEEAEETEDGTATVDLDATEILADGANAIETEDSAEVLMQELEFTLLHREAVHLHSSRDLTLRNINFLV